MSAHRPLALTQRAGRTATPGTRRPAGVWGRRAAGVALPLTGALLLLAAWWALKVLNDWPAFILPSPVEVVATVVSRWDEMAHHAGVTLWETVAGFVLATVIAIPIGVALAYSGTIDRMFSPILFGFNAVPKVAVAPLLVIWMGFGQLPKIVMVVLLAFFPIVLSTAAGLKSTSEELRELVRSLGALPGQAFFKVRLPSALPHIFVGLKVAVSLAVIGAVIGEFVGAREGLGYLMVVSGGTADTTLAFAALAMLALISIALYYILLLVERLVIPWAEETS